MIPITRPYLPPLEDYERLLERVWGSHMLSNFGPFARELEAVVSTRIGTRSRVVVSGDIGLVIAIAALGMPEGASVVLPSFTFNSTVNAVLWNRLRPVFADIDVDSFHVDPEQVEAAVRRTKASLILATHVFGAPADVEPLQDVARRLGVHLLFDAAHAYGASHAGRAIGSFGDAEVFSLSGTKPVTTGEGGLITSRDDDLLRKVDYLRAYGFQDDYNSVVVGLNGKMSEMHACLGLLTLPRVDEAIAVRGRLVERYKEAFGPFPGLSYQRVGMDDISTYKDFAILFATPDARLRAESALTRAEVQTKRYFLPCHRMPAFRRFTDGDLPVTEDVHERLLCVPIFEELTDEQLSLVANVIRESWHSA